MHSISRLQTPVLVLNASYEPINVCAARRALVLLLKGVASAEEEAREFVHSPSRAVAVPSVIRLLEYRRIPPHTLALSPQNILLPAPPTPPHFPATPVSRASGRSRPPS